MPIFFEPQISEAIRATKLKQNEEYAPIFKLELNLFSDQSMERRKHEVYSIRKEIKDFYYFTDI